MLQLLLVLFLCLPAQAKRPALVGSSARKFQNLTEENKSFVKSNYMKILKAHEKKDFQEMVDAAKNILSLVDDYNDTRSYEAIGLRGLKESQEKVSGKQHEQHLREISELEIKGQQLMKKAGDNAESRTELYLLMEKLLAIDPQNPFPAEWRKRLQSH